jgi:integrase
MATDAIREALRYKDLEALSARQGQAWLPEGSPNLYAFCPSFGTVTWVARIVVAGKRTNITLGTWPEVKAEAARAAAAAVKGLVKAGHGTQSIRNALAISIEPLALAQIVTGERVSSKSATPTFAEVATKWFDEHASGGISNDDYRRQVFQQVRDYAFPALGERPVNAIKRAEIVDAISAVWLRYDTVGKRLRGNIERILDYVVDRGWCEFNVCPPVRSMPAKARVITHHAALEPVRAPDLWRWLQTADLGKAAHVGLALALITGKRSGEIRLMEWSHLDLDRAIWVTPAIGMKTRKAHRQPLSKAPLAAIEGIRPITEGGQYVLGRKPPHENLFFNAIKQFDQNPTVHGLRACLGSWMAETGVRKPVADFVLAHQQASIDAAYQRSDLLEERRGVLERWAKYVTG